MMRVRSALSWGPASITLAAALLAVLLPRVLFAAPSPADQAAAQELFDQARRLLDEGKFDEACTKFEGSQRLDPGAGTLLNLATCNQRIGRLATAWTQFNEALSLAIRDGRRDRISFARDHIAAVEPHLPRLTVKVVAPETDGLSVAIDRAPLGKAAWGIATPVDPGAHVVEASAPGRLPFKSTVELASGEAKALEVPLLAEDPKAVATRQAPAPGEPPRAPWGASATRRIAGDIALGAGALALGVGAYFGLRTMSIWSDANANCPNDLCNPHGESLTRDARSAARAADAAIGLGIASVGAAAVLFLTAGGGSTSAPRVGVTLASDARGGGLSLHGAW